jgi:hypothetical protein
MESAPRLARAVRAVMALTLFLLGAFMLGLALGVVSPAEGAVRTPGGLVGIGGLVFLVAGTAVVFQHRPAAGWLAAMFMLACGAAAGLWIGLVADPGEISGGVPFISESANTRLGRAAFALGGLLCLALLAWGLWLGPERQRRD